MSEYKIQHQEPENLFYVHLEDGQRAYLKYKHSGLESAVSQVDFWSTFVPDSHRGKGLASKLVEAGFSWAEGQGLHMQASCWYARLKLDKRQAENK